MSDKTQTPVTEDIVQGVIPANAGIQGIEATGSRLRLSPE